MDAEEFMRAALRAGAAIEFVDGKLVVQPPAPSVEVGSAVAPEAKLERRSGGTNKNKSYPIMKELLAPHTSSHIAHVAAALAVMHGHRTGEWVPGIEALKRFMNGIDLDVLVQCAIRAINLKHGIKVRNKRVTMSTGAMGAALYDTLDKDPALSLDLLEDRISGTAMVRKIKELASDVDHYGGARTIEFRRQSYNAFTAILADKEV